MKRLLIKEALKAIISKLRGGFNPITKITILPPGVNLNLADTASVPTYGQPGSRPDVNSISLDIHTDRIKAASLVAKELEKENYLLIVIMTLK